MRTWLTMPRIERVPWRLPLARSQTWWSQGVRNGNVANLLIDTDVFIDHLRGARRLTLADNDVASYSVVTLCELFAGTRVDEGSVRTLLAPFATLVVDQATAEHAGVSDAKPRHAWPTR